MKTAPATHDVAQRQCHWQLEKYDGAAAHAQGVASELIQGDGNLLTTNGANILWQKLTAGVGQIFVVTVTISLS